jgi:hypothetical protein
MCADGKADADRTRRLIEASSTLREAARILDQVRDPRALAVLLAALAGDVKGRTRKAVVLAAGSAGCEDPTAVAAIVKELKDPDVEVAEAAVDALADTTVETEMVNDALAETMTNRAELHGRAALALGWRRDVRALHALEDWIKTKGFVIGGNRFPEQILGRLGAPGYTVLRRKLSATLAAHPDPPQYRWNEPDRTVHDLLRGLVGRYGEPDELALAIAERTVAGCPWAQQRLAEIIADIRGEPPPGRTVPPAIDAANRGVPRWGMRFRRVEHAEPAPVTRFGGQPFFPGDPVWPLHPKLGLPLTFLGQIVVPATVAGDGTWLVHIFIDLGNPPFKGDGYAYELSEPVVILHPAGRWSGRTDSRRSGPTRPHEWPDWELDRERFRPGPQFGLTITEIDLVAGADPSAWPESGDFSVTADDWNKVGGTPLTLQGGEDRLIADGWRFVASFGAWEVGREMGDVAHCTVWIHPDGRGLLDVQSH